MKEKIISVLFVIILFSFAVGKIVIDDREISSYERRKLVSVDSLKENLVGNLDKYMSDQFPLRDELISINSIFDRYFLGNKDANGVYVIDDVIVEKNYPLDKKSIDRFIDKINYIDDTYLKTSNVYYTIIPDKSYFLDEVDYLKIDFQYLYDKIEKEIDANYIDVASLLKLENYYKTDIHIKQEAYGKVIETLVNDLGYLNKSINFEKNVYDNFYGASYSKVSKLFKPDYLVTLTNDVFSDCIVKHLEYGYKDIYDEEKLNSSDLYNIFLSGPSALVEIENLRSENEKELIIFRDSFASSFTPLLIPYFKKITLIDLRYIKMDLVSNYVDFANKDILFAYSTLLVNNSNLIKVDFN